MIYDQVKQNKFENDEDQIMQEDNSGCGLMRDKSKSHWERNTGERQGEQNNRENETITWPTWGIKPIRFREM